MQCKDLYEFCHPTRGKELTGKGFRFLNLGLSKIAIFGAWWRCPVILSKVSYRGSFWGAVFSGVGFWSPSGLKNCPLKPAFFIL